MLVIAGRPVELDAHIERLSTSVAELYGGALPAETRALVLEGARELKRGKLRLTVMPDGYPLRLDVTVSEVDPGSVFPSADQGAALRSVVVAGGLGEHKWADRRLLDRIAASLASGELPLLLDEDDSVLEVSRASVFAIRDGRLATPPTDGRILPSIARRQAIEAAADEGIEAHEERLSLAELQASEIFLTGSVRGVEPVHSIDGVELPPRGKISELVAAGLRRRWRVPAGEPAAAASDGRPVDLPVR